MLRTVFDSVTDSDVSMRAFWLADCGAGTEELRAGKWITIAAAPNVPVGWHMKERHIPVTVTCGTHSADDPTRAELSEMYHECRQAVDTRTWTDTAFNQCNITVTEPTAVLSDGLVNLIEWTLDVHVCAAT